MSSKPIDHQIVGVFLRLCQDVGSPYSLAQYERAVKGDWDGLLNSPVLPENYDNAYSYALDNSVYSFFKKCRDLPTSFNRRQAAIDKFWEGERDCYRTNERLSPFLHGAHAPGEERINEFIIAVKKRIRDLIGRRPPTLIEGRHGPGATFSDRGHLTTAADKMASVPTMTRDCIYHLFQWSATAWARAHANHAKCAPMTVKGNRFVTVPKDAKTDRGICVEPSINVFYQLGYGKALRRALAFGGIDLRDGQTIHRRVACEASRNGSYCTIDLKNASDTLCSNLVKLLLPTAWHDCLRDLRSPHTLLEGKWVRLEKFSSMGNGYTFELETLIFFALVSEACASMGFPSQGGCDVFVYGDDIICPNDAYEGVVNVLKFFGFTPNKEKSFNKGWFRESCGGDFFNGSPVRGYYLKEFPRGPHEIISMANGIRRLGSSNDELGDLDHANLRAWLWSLDLLPSHIRRLRGPVHFGDLVIHDVREKWITRTRHEIRYIRALGKRSIGFVPWSHFRPEVALATALYGVGDGRRGVLPRGAVSESYECWVAG